MVKVVVDKNWLQARLKALGKTQRAMAALLGVNPAAITNLLKGERKLSVSEAVKLPLFLDCTIGDVLLAFGGKDALLGSEKVKIMGHVDEADRVVLYDSSQSLEEVASPFPGYVGMVVRIRGSEHAPRFRHNELMAFTPVKGDIRTLVGKEAFVKIRGGDILLKVVQQGSRDGLFNLVSLNRDTPVIVDAQLEWAAEIDWHKP